MGVSHVLRLLGRQPHAGDFAHLFARHVWAAYEISRILEKADVDELAAVRNSFRVFATLSSLAANRAREAGLLERDSGRPGGRLRRLFDALEDSTRRFNCLAHLQRVIAEAIELAILTHHPPASDTARRSALAQLCFSPPMPLEFSTIERHMSDWRGLTRAVIAKQGELDRMWLNYAIEVLVDDACVEAAIASVTPLPQQTERVKVAESVLVRALDVLCAPPDYAEAPRPLLTFEEGDQLRPILKAIVEGHTRMRSNRDLSPEVEWRPDRRSSRSVLVVLPDTQIFWNDAHVWSKMDEYVRDPIDMIEQRESSIPTSFTVTRLKNWQRELQDIRMGRKVHSAAAGATKVVALGTVEQFAELQGVSPHVIVGIGAMFEVIARLRAR